jgi:hypothetical protein
LSEAFSARRQLIFDREQIARDVLVGCLMWADHSGLRGADRIGHGVDPPTVVCFA